MGTFCTFFILDWMAPEVINSKPYTFPADVYSFGVEFIYKIVIWEICSR